MLAALAAVAIDLVRVFSVQCHDGLQPPVVDDTVLDGTGGEAFRRGPELHRENLLWQVIAGARRSADAAVLQVYAPFRHGWTGFQVPRARPS